MANYAIYRVEAVKGGGAGLARHHLRESTPPNAQEGAAKPRLLVGQGVTSHEVMQRVKTAIERHNATQPRKLQKNSPTMHDLFIGMSTSMGPEKDLQYFKRALAWVTARYGAENVLFAAIHDDETTPHMQILVMPRRGDKFASSAILGGRSDFRKMQDSFHEVAGKPFGLSRGERRSEAKHIKIKQFYAALDRSKDALPERIPVPAAPTWLQKLRGKGEAIEKARKAAIEHNSKVEKTIKALAAAARGVHPEVVRRNSVAYREAKQARADAEALAKTTAQMAEAGRLAREDAAAIEQRLLGNRGAALTAKALRLLPQAQVDQIAKTINPGLHLVAGRDLVDQMRKQGYASGLSEGLKKIEAAIDDLQALGVRFSVDQVDGVGIAPPGG